MSGVRSKEVEVTAADRLRLSDRLEELIGHDATGTLLRSLAQRPTVKVLNDDDQALARRLEEVLGEVDAAVLIALLPHWTFEQADEPSAPGSAST